MSLCISKFIRHDKVWWLSYNIRKISQSGCKFTGESAYVKPTVHPCNGISSIMIL